ncbi:hypothetical protein BDV93DRAFT_609647 [Ceratobasidium sp. AG-I]|nr:hypothetical protein BDV93DRAFT_609647 [Ceratobasidium sp. AG-I]
MKMAPASQFLTIATLRLNKHLLMYFDTSDLSLLPLFDERPAASGRYQRTGIENLTPKSLLVLGLTGLVEASGDTNCADAFGPNDMGIVFERLRELSISWGYSPFFEPLASANTFDLRRYAVETVFNYYNRNVASSPTESLSTCVGLLESILQCPWDDVSWITGIIFKTLTGSTNDEMRDAIADFLYWKSESVSQQLQIYSILYEMLRAYTHTSLSHFCWNRCRYICGITHSFNSTILTNGYNREDMDDAVDAFLGRLVKNGLLDTLILTAYTSHYEWMKGSDWHGIRCWATTRFWGERIILLARKSRDQLAASDGPQEPTMTDRIRSFCLAPYELPDEFQNNDEPGENGNLQGIDPDERKRKQVQAKELQRHLEELKYMVLQKIDTCAIQPTLTEAPPQLPVYNAQPSIPPNEEHPSKKSHIVIHVPEGELKVTTSKYLTCALL